MKKILIALLAAALVLTGCAKAKTADTGRTTLKWYGSGEIPTIDSSNTGDTLSAGVIYYFQEGLTRLDDKSEVTKGTAESWTVSDDGTVYTFKIRDKAKWSNGDEVTADDFVFAWQRVADPSFAAVSANNLVLSNIKNAAAVIAGQLPITDLGIKAIDEKTLEVTLDQPNAYFLKNISGTIFYPLNRAFVTSLGDKYATSADTVISNGPFVFKNWDGTGLTWSYEKNENYWDKGSIKLTNVDVSVVKEQGTLVNLFDSNEIDGISLTGDYVTQYADSENLVSVPTLSASNIEIGISSNPILQNVNFRKALLYSVDRDELVNYVLNGQATALTSVIVDGIATDPKNGKSIKEETGDIVVTDLTKAQEYFAKAQAELGQTTFTVGLLTSDSDSAKRTGEYLKSAWEKALPGLTIDFTPVVTSVRFSKMMSFKFDLALGGWSGGFDPLSYVEQHNITSAHNHSQYVNATFNDLIAKIKTEGNDAQARWDDILAAQKILLEDAVEIPLYQGVSNFLVNKNLKNVVTRSIGSVTIDFTYAYFE